MVVPAEHHPLGVGKLFKLLVGFAYLYLGFFYLGVEFGKALFVLCEAFLVLFFAFRDLPAHLSQLGAGTALGLIGKFHLS